MTVGELIFELSQHPEDKEVLTVNGFDVHLIQSVEKGHASIINSMTYNPCVFIIPKPKK